MTESPHYYAEYQRQRGIFNFYGEMVKGNIESKTAKTMCK